ncbi:hypothetical protein FACS189485_23560 [Spirochaetia bacterium]|nr:hypothetical protein FACS189485_23560 [Spirochaetia bacterium]
MGHNPGQVINGDRCACGGALFRKHFDKWFSELKIDTQKNLLYKTYFITEDVRVKPTEMIYLFNCISELNIKLK